MSILLVGAAFLVGPMPVNVSETLGSLESFGLRTRRNRDHGHSSGILL